MKVKYFLSSGHKIGLCSFSVQQICRLRKPNNSLCQLRNLVKMRGQNLEFKVLAKSQTCIAHNLLLYEGFCLKLSFIPKNFRLFLLWPKPQSLFSQLKQKQRIVGKSGMYKATKVHRQFQAYRGGFLSFPGL